MNKNNWTIVVEQDISSQLLGNITSALRTHPGILSHSSSVNPPSYSPACSPKPPELEGVWLLCFGRLQSSGFRSKSDVLCRYSPERKIDFFPLLFLTDILYFCSFVQINVSDQTNVTIKQTKNLLVCFMLPDRFCLSNLLILHV